MRIDILGPLSVTAGETAVELKGANKRSVLALLAVHANQAVPIHQLLARLWPDDVPAKAVSCLRNTIVDLQRTVGALLDGGRLSTSASGYQLQVAPDNVDLHRARRLAREAREQLSNGSVAVAVGRFAEAERLWRGPALLDVARAGLVWPETAELDEEYLTLVEDRITAQLTAGHYDSVVDELPGLIQAEPLRERRYAMLMLALIGVGRPDRARIVYRQAGAALAQDWGLDPGPHLRKLHRLISDVDAGRGARASAGSPSPGPGSVQGTILMLCVRASPGGGLPRPEWARVSCAWSTSVTPVIEQAGGRVVSVVGGTMLALFDVDGHEERAVRTAWSLRSEMLSGGEPVSGSAHPTIAETLRLTAAIATGRVWSRPGEPDGTGPVIVGAPVEACRRLLRAARSSPDPGNQILVANRQSEDITAPPQAVSGRA